MLMSVQCVQVHTGSYVYKGERAKRKMNAKILL